MIQPVGDRVLILQEKAESKAGLMVTEQRRFPRGKVVAISPTCEVSEDVRSGLEVGSIVVFNDLAGQRVDDEGKEYLIVKSQDILAVLK